MTFLGEVAAFETVSFFDFTTATGLSFTTFGGVKTTFLTRGGGGGGGGTGGGGGGNSLTSTVGGAGGGGGFLCPVCAISCPEIIPMDRNIISFFMIIFFC
ncbi:MAG: hypothetical protein ABJB11_10520 [Ferruginibacter sp.]